MSEPTEREAELLALLVRVPGAINNAFMAGGEEREFGSASRQERLMESVHQLRADIHAAISKAEPA